MPVVRALPIVAIALAATPSLAAEIQIPVSNPVIELTVTEVVQSPPDSAQVGAGVSVRAPTAQEALRKNAEQMDRVIKTLREIGIERKDIQTANFNLNAQYRYNREGDAPTFLGYDASNQVNVTLRDMDRIGQALDTLVAAGANNVYGPSFRLEKDEAAKAKGRKAALGNAKARAEEYAQASGFSGLRLLEISETYGTSAVPFGGNEIIVTAAKASNQSATTVIEPGEVGTATTITVKYEMTR